MRAIVMMALLQGVASPSPEVAVTHARPTMGLAALLITACEEPLAPPLDTVAPGRVMLSIVADTLTTPFGDAHIRNDHPNRQLEAPGLSVRTTLESTWRVLVSWKQDSIVAVVGVNAVDSAFLEFEVIDVTGEAGGYVGLHRATQEWGEDEVTWNCANDPINNDELDCDAADLWDMTNPAQWPFVSAPTDSAFVNESTSGFVRFEVTSDVQAFVSGSAQNYGWVLKRTDESQAGFVWLYDKDSPPPPAGPGAPPKLILHVATQDTSRPSIPDSLGLPTDTTFTVPSPFGTTELYHRDIVGVTFDDSTSGTTVQQILAKYSAVVIGGIPSSLLPVYYIRVPDPGPTHSGIDSVAIAIANESGVGATYVPTASGRVRFRSRFPTDGTDSKRTDWFDPTNATRPLIAINAPQAWGCENGQYGGTVAVAIVDREFDQHDDLLISGSARPPISGTEFKAIATVDDLEHGIKVAGIFGATGGNDMGTAGMMWMSDLNLYELGQNGGTSVDPIADWNAHVTHAVDTAGVRVISTSVAVGSAADSATTAYFRKIFRTVFQADRLLVYAIGNDTATITLEALKTTTDSRFAASDRALAQLRDSFPDSFIIVTAADTANDFLSGSNFWTGGTDIAAPGQNILTLGSGNSTSIATGSSFAAAYVAGVAAQLWAMNPSLSTAQVRDFVLRGAQQQSRDSTGQLIARLPVSGAPEDVFLLDAYASLRLASDEVANSPVCGYEVRLEDNEIVFEKPSGQIVKPFPGQSENTSRGGISVAQGGRLIAVSANLTGQPGGEGVLVLNQTAGVVAQIPGPFYRQYLERDTVDVFVSPTADSSFPDPGRLVITRGRTGAVQDFDLLAITSPDPQTQGTRIARIDVAPSGQYAAIQGLYFGTLPDAGPRVYIVPLVPGAPAIQVGNRDRTPSAPCQNSLTGALGPLWSHDSRRLSTAFSTLTRNAPQTLPMWINTCTVWSTFNLLSDSGSVVFASDTGSVAFQGTAIFAHRLTGDDRFMITTEMNADGFNNSPFGPCDIVLRNALTPALFSSNTASRRTR